MSLAMDLIYLFTITIILLLLWLHVLAKKRQLDIPRPPGLPIIGHALELGSTTAMIKGFMKYKISHGGIYNISIGLRQFAVVSDYKFLEFILANQKLLTKSDDYDFIWPWLGLGLLTSDGMRWKKHRRLITPAFHLQILDSFIEIFERCGKKLVEKLKKEVHKSSIDVYDFITLCTLDIICETAMGTNINAQDLATSDYVKSVKDMGKIVMLRTVSPIKMYDFLFRFTPDYYAQRRALKILHGHTESVIASRIQERKSKKEDQDQEQNDFGIKRKKVFIDLLLDATVDGEQLSPKDIREEVDTFMFEGHDTTSACLSYSLYCLAQHPEVQKKVIEEQDELFGGNRDPQEVTQSDLQDMKYLEMVIKETLRLYPSVPFFGRKLIEDLEFNGVKYPKDVTLTIFAYGIHRDPQYFEDPEVFNPSRFETITGKLPYAYIPFSAGPRNCIGQRFAMLELKSTLSKLVRAFEIVPAVPKHELVLSAETIMKSVNGVRVGLKLRT